MALLGNLGASRKRMRVQAGPRQTQLYYVQRKDNQLAAVLNWMAHWGDRCNRPAPRLWTIFVKVA